MPLIATPLNTPTDTTPPATTAAEAVSDYMDLMSDQGFRKNWREGSNSAEHFTPAEIAEMYRLKQQQELDAARRGAGIFQQISD